MSQSPDPTPPRPSDKQAETGSEIGPDAGGPVILQVLPSLVSGGVERGTVDMAAAIVEAGGRAIVASSGGPMVRELARAGAKHVALPLAGKNPWRIAKNADLLIALMRREGVDLVHARSRAPAWSAWRACRRTGTPFVTTVHAHYAINLPGKRRYNSVMTRGDRVIAISNYIAGYIQENYKVDPSIIRTIPRGVDIRRFDPAAVTAERVIKLARDWRLPDGVPVIAVPARLTRLKGHLVILDALARLKIGEVRCLFIGSDQGRKRYREELEARIRQLGLESSVHITDHCDDMASAYKLADVVVSATTEPEGFGRVIVEAQAMGRPVIATAIGAPQETVTPGRTGWLTPPGDPDALAAALEEALTLSPDQRQTLAERTIAHVRDHYSRERMCDATLDVYEELLIGRQAANHHAAAHAALPTG